MRSDAEMLELILGVARDDARIRVALMNGSRANPNAPRDFFQDFDVVYFVTDVDSFARDRDWIKRFGELMILQLPEEMGDPPPSQDGGFTYLMQFKDGNRIDLGIYPVQQLDDRLHDSLTVLLLDKDGLVPPVPAASEKDYLPEPPSAKAFADCCNEFWWVCPYVAKGLWRREIVYAKYMLDEVVRAQLLKMLNWHVGIRTGFARNPGKYGKYLQQYLEPELWDLLLQTYSDAGDDATWEALLTMTDLFRRAATGVAEHFRLAYPADDDRNVSAHLRHVRALPRDASQMY